MKLFFRQNIPYIVMTLLMAALMMGTYWLDGYHHGVVLVYASFLVLFILVAYLLFSYLTQRNLYRSMEKGQGKLVLYEDLKKDSAPLSLEVSRLLEKQFLNYYQELKDLKNARDEHTRFVNRWVHQMKTPLAVIELMVQDGNLNQESLLEECDRLKEGLTLALNMSRLEDFQKDFVVEEVNLKEVASEAVKEHKRNFIRHYVYPKVDIADNLQVETDEKWLLFIVEQLLSNAIKYSSGSEKEITIAAYEKAGRVYLEVRDQGIGIEKSDLPRVFQAFFTGENGRRYHEATGMGLYLVKEICKELNHEITVTSEIGKGSIFTVVFQ